MTTYTPHPDPRKSDLVWVSLAIPDTPHHVWVIVEVAERRGDKAEVRFFDDSTCLWLSVERLFTTRRRDVGGAHEETTP